MSTLNAQTTAWGFLLRFLPLGVGMGIFQSPNNSAIMGSASQRHLGIVSGMLAVTRTVGLTIGIAVLGALWASRVFVYLGDALDIGATNAPPGAQVSALQYTFLVMTSMMAAALFVAFWALVQERRSRPVAPVG